MLTIFLICIWAFNIAMAVDTALMEYELMEMSNQMHCFSYIAQIHANDTTIEMSDVLRDALRHTHWGFYEANHSGGSIEV